MKYNNLFSRAVSVMALAGLTLPSVAAAQSLDVTAGVRAPAVNVEVRANVCTRIAAHLGEVESHLLDLRVKVDARSNEREQKLEERRADRGGKVGEREETADEQRVEFRTKLEARAETEVQRAAIVKYQASVNAAVDARRASYLAANETFRKGVDAAVTSRRAQVEAAVTRFRAAIKTALEQAKTNCDAGTTQTTMSTRLRTAIAAAKTRFEADRKALDRTGAQVKTLAETRKAAHAKAMTLFRTDMERARVELKAAFSAEAKTQ